MSARLAAARRIRTVAAATVVAAVAGTALLPVTAQAADSTSGKPLSMTLGAPVPGSPLSRGGATATTLLTVTNSSDKAQDFQAWLLGEANGPSPLLKDSVVYDVAPVNAPATKSLIGRQDGQWQGLFFPASGTAADSFTVPAKSEFTWKVTIGLGAHYPTNDGDFTLIAGPLSNNVSTEPATSKALFKSDPQIKPGSLDLTWTRGDNTVARPGQRARLTLNATATGPGEFPAELRRTVIVEETPGHELGNPDFVVEAEIGGKLVKLKQVSVYEWELPAVPKGFGAASGTQSIDVFLSLGEHTDLKKDTELSLRATFSMADTYDFNGIATKVTAGPARTAPSSPSATPSDPATSSPSPSGSATASPAPSTGTAATGGTNGGTTATGTMADTGSDVSGYGFLAAALLALGGVAAWFGVRRRRSTTV